MKAIVDTGFLVAFARQPDRYHDWAVEVARIAEPPFLTCEAVLAEAAFHLGSADYVLRLLGEGMLRIEFSLSDHRERLRTLAAQFADREPDIADLCLICLSELHPRHAVVTTDRKDFTVYRRNRRQVLPLWLPPH